MDNKIFEILHIELLSFFDKYNLNYEFKENKEYHNTKIREYTSYKQCYYYAKENMQLECSLITYPDKKFKTFIDIKVSVFYKKELIKWLSINEYFKQILKIKSPFLNELTGNNLEEQIVSYFAWLRTNIDYKVIDILKGNDWLDMPFDWNGYK